MQMCMRNREQTKGYRWRHGVVSFIQAIQERVAVVAISPSAVRKAGAPGVVAASTRFLAALDLWRFATSNQIAFGQALDDGTNQLLCALPEKARSWGLARKCMNVFLRDALYNAYLRDEFGLAKAEHFYEIPLDSIVVRELRKRDCDSLPRWKGVKYLQRNASDTYQLFAANHAASDEYQHIPPNAKKKLPLKMARVHLDTYLWVQGRKNQS